MSGTHSTTTGQITVDYDKPPEEWTDEEIVTLTRRVADHDSPLGEWVRETYPSLDSGGDAL